MLVSRGSFASTQSYGVTTTTDSSQNIWSTCLPKNPTFPGAFTSTAVCFTSSTNGGISGYSSAPVNIFTFPWLFWAGINVSGTSTLQSANITNTTFSGALTFSPGSSMTSTIQSEGINIIPIYGYEASAFSTTVHSALFAAGTNDCGFAAALNYCYNNGSIICNVILPPICYPTVTLQNTISALAFVQIGGQSASDISVIIPLAPITGVLNTDNHIKYIGNVIFYNAYNQNIGYWITQTSQYKTYNNVIFSGNTLTASAVLYNSNGSTWSGFSTVFNNCSFNNNNTTAPYSIYAYSLGNTYGDDIEPITVSNSTVKGNIYFENVVVRWINNYTNNGGNTATWILNGITDSTFENLHAATASIYISNTQQATFDHTGGTDTFIIDAASSQIHFTNCLDEGSSLIIPYAVLSIINTSASPVMLTNCSPSGTLTGNIQMQNGNTFTGGTHVDSLTATTFTTLASGFTTMTAGFTNVTLSKSFSGLGFGCFFAPVNVTNSNAYAYGFTPTAVNSFTIVSSSSTDTNKVWYECHGD